MPPSQSVDSVTGHRMIYVITKTQTTLYDQVTFSGSPSSFAWILPIHGKVDVGLSADVLFQTFDEFTATIVNAPPLPCEDEAGSGQSSGGGSAGGPGGQSVDEGGVAVVAEGQVGPYETVQLASTDGSALYAWLQKNGYQLSSAEEPVISDYVSQGMNFLAMKLVPGANVHAIRPIRITTVGASPTLPLHMVSVGTGALTSITLWVVAEGRYAPHNAPFFTISGSELTWDWATDTSNYDALRVQKEKALAYSGWQVESSIDIGKVAFTDAFQGNVMCAEASGDAGAEGGCATSSGYPDDGGSMSAAANADLKVLYDGISGHNIRVTRLRTDLAHSALSNDLVLEAACDQSELSNNITTGHQIHAPCSSGPLDDASTGSGATDDGPSSAVAEVGQPCVPNDGSGDFSTPDGGGSQGGGGGCNTAAPFETPADDLAIVGSLILGLATIGRVRRKKEKGVRG